jgi:hypothetical protein
MINLLPDIIKDKILIKVGKYNWKTNVTKLNTEYHSIYKWIDHKSNCSVITPLHI